MATKSPFPCGQLSRTATMPFATTTQKLYGLSIYTTARSSLAAKISDNHFDKSSPIFSLLWNIKSSSRFAQSWSEGQGFSTSCTSKRPQHLALRLSKFPSRMLLIKDESSAAPGGPAAGTTANSYHNARYDGAGITAISSINA